VYVFRPTPEPSRRAALVALLATLSIVALLALGHAHARAATPDQVTLRVWPAGQGRIDVSQNGSALTSCDFLDILANQTECAVLVTNGRPVTLTAVAEPGAIIPPELQNAVPDFPAPQPALVRWSRFDCALAPSCTFIPDTEADWITALFTPLQLEVGVNGAGSVSVQTAGGGLDPLTCEPLDFGDTTCHGLFPADSDVVLVANPADPLDPVRWGPGCEPDGGSPASARCTVSITNIRTFAGVAFGDPSQVSPPDRPFQVTPTIRVLRDGSGEGRVTGSGIDCGRRCSVDVDYQSRVDLRAAPSPGSRFVRWVGVCSAAPTCRFSAGSATAIKAVFDSSSNASSTTTNTTRPGSRPLRSRLARVTTRGRGARRRVVLVVVVDRPARARLRLLKRGRSIAARSFTLRTGSNALRLRVPRRARPGRYGLALRVAAAGTSRTFRTSVRIRR